MLPTDPRAGYRAHEEEIRQAIQGVLDAGTYILGSEVAGFEREFAAYLGVRSAIGVASGTDALYLALLSCGLRPGDGVLTVSHTAVATIAAIEMAGAIPILIDVDPLTHTLDPDRLEDACDEYRALSAEVSMKAIVAVHLYGHPADMTALQEIASRYDLFVIEDCAQAHGSAIEGVKTGSWGAIGAFSFYPTKNLPALGDAGAIVTNHPDFGERARMLREYGWRERYVSQLPGTNSRLDEIQAAILRVRLRHLEAENQRRRELAGLYSDQLRDLPLVLPIARGQVSHVYHQYVIQTSSRDELRRYLDSRRIKTLVHYPVPVHLQPAYRDRLPIHRAGLPRTERLSAEILSLPMHPFLTEAQATRVVEEIRGFYGRGGSRPT
ncbi:MAG: DegT/DnrJ/EryC1/StrS family aminotransferase [Acidobacteria bacterium]|nr:MAG: DegT/DnrJ/EryC1/StrS family aminotransferase [Acidobacteriota bacterium]